MSEKETGASRRDFLKLAGAATPAAVVAAVPGTVHADEADAETAGLRRTEHVRKYLETARF